MKKIFLISIIWMFCVSTSASEINLSSVSLKGKWKVVTEGLVKNMDVQEADGNSFWVFTENQYTTYTFNDIAFSSSYTTKGSKIIAQWPEYYGKSKDEQYLIEVRDISNEKMQAIVNGFIIYDLIRVSK